MGARHHRVRSSAARLVRVVLANYFLHDFLRRASVGTRMHILFFHVPSSTHFEGTSIHSLPLPDYINGSSSFVRRLDASVYSNFCLKSTTLHPLNQRTRKQNQTVCPRGTNEPHSPNRPTSRAPPHDGLPRGHRSVPRRRDLTMRSRALTPERSR